jgi:hypothetical protein
MNIKHDKLSFYAYRGHSNKTFKLEPSVYHNDNFLKNEHKMFNEIIISKPEEFRDCRYTIDYLAKMQHYGLPTRLLDITANPLIALLFASCENDKEDGEVICFRIPKEKVKTFDSDTVSILANTAKLKFERSNYTIPMCIRKCQTKTYSYQEKEDYCEERCKMFYNDTDNESIHYLQYEINAEKSHFLEKINPLDIGSVICVQTKRENPRIINQSGLFFLFGICEKDKEMPAIRSDWEECRIGITKFKKKKIMCELKKIGIDIPYVFPELSKVAEEIKKQYET